MEKYNTKVRQAISEKYVECSKSRGALMKELEDVSIRLTNETDKLTYKDYMELKDRGKHLQRKIEDLSIMIDTWDKAREICLDIVDEML